MLVDFKRDSQLAAIALSLAVATGLFYHPRSLLALLLLPVFLLSLLLSPLVVHLVLSYLAAARGVPSKHGSDPLVPLLSIATPSGLEAARIRKQWQASKSHQRFQLAPNSLKVSAALDRLIDIILDNYLNSWYKIVISPSDTSFPDAVNRTIRDVLVEIRERLAEVDWASLGVTTLVPKITSHLELFTEAQQTLLSATNGAGNAAGQGGFPEGQGRNKQKSPSAVPAGEELDLLLSEKYAALLDGKGLHPAVSGASFNSRPSEEKHLRFLVERILAVVMPKREADSKAVNVMTMEIVACAVIRPIIEAISDPDLWNRMLDEKAGAAIREQRMVNKLRAALDANTSIPNTPTGTISSRSEAISLKSSTRQFESFLRYLGRSPNLLEAKRMRNDIEVNLRRARLPDAYTDEPRDVVVKYIDRLGQAKQAIDKRIAVLGGSEASNATTSLANASSLSLQDILHQAGSLSFFMEYMDRRNRSMLVQFYLTVEGLKDPLEDDMGVEPLASQSTQDASGDVKLSAVQALRDDVQLLLSIYIDPKKVPLSESSSSTLEIFSQATDTGQALSKASYSKIRRAIFTAQHEVYEDMVEQDWPKFKRSDLYNKAAAEMPSRTIQSGLPGSPRSVRSRNAGKTFLDSQTILSSGSSSSQDSANGLTKQVLSSVRPAPVKRAGTASLAFAATSTRPKQEMRRNSDFTPNNDIFGSDKLDFLTGGAGTVDERSPLFKEEGASPSTAEAVLEEPDDLQQLETMEAIQEALSSILAGDDQSARKDDFSQPPKSPSPEESPEQSMLSPRSVSSQTPSIRHGTPSADIASKRPFWHLRSASGRSELEAQTSVVNAFPEEDAERERLSGDDLSSSVGSLKARLAGPGNLQLPAEIDRLTERIDKLKNQEAVLSALLRKADLTGSADEMKILQKSTEALRREISELAFQKRQFISQADENRLLQGRTSVNIAGTTVGQSQGKEFALYLIEVHQLAEDGQTHTAGWLVTRRFSEFVALHTALKDKLPAVRQLDLPNKRLVTSMSSSLLTQRRVALEKYLKSMIALPGACTSREVRAFLSQQTISLADKANTAESNSAMFPGQGIIKNLFKSVTDGMDDLFGGPSMLDAMILRLSQQAADFAGSMNLSLQNEDLISSVFGGTSASTSAAQTAATGEGAPIDLLSLSAGLSPAEGEGLTSFTAPIANLLVEVFDLKDKSSWLRRQAIIIILQQVLGGTIERKVREAISIGLAGDALLPHIEMVTHMMWPDGKARPPSMPRTAEEKLQTRESAYRKLTYLMPDVAASIIGRSNARRGARRFFSVMQNRRLNQHIIYTLLDDILVEIFGSSLKTRPK